MEEIFEKVKDTVRPTITLIWAAITWMMFPEESFIIWCIGLWVAVGLDLLTRWFAIFRKSKGVIKAIRTRAWNSEDMFEKTKVKVISYLVIQIMAGLSMRFIGIPLVCNVVATVIYAFLFFREFGSVVENLIEAGATYLKPLLFWVRKKTDEALEQETTIHEESDKDDHSEQI
jgi:hypothetical protein